MIQRALNGLHRSAIWLTCMALAALTVVVVMQVAGRYVPGIPRLPWTEEIARLSFTWFVLIGAAVAWREDEHFIVDVIPDSWLRVKGPLNRLGDVLVALVSLGLVVGGIAFFEQGTTRVSQVTGMTLSWAFLAMPVSGALILVFTCERLFTRHGSNDLLAERDNRYTETDGVGRP